jgi:hypothetical protein
MALKISSTSSELNFLRLPAESTPEVGPGTVSGEIRTVVSWNKNRVEFTSGKDSKYPVYRRI